MNKSKVAEMSKEVNQLENNVTTLVNIEKENKIAKMYEFVHRNLDPVLDTFTALVETPEGRAALEKDWLNLKWIRG